jgi:TetR/AcrR family transcriptional regulator, copper-responsive repressor
MGAPSAKLGRPRTFDRAAALETATQLFWRHGYDGTSISDLTSAMGVSPPTLYGAFGSKAALFRECLQSYAKVISRPIEDAFSRERTAREAVTMFLRLSARELTVHGRPPGCMISTGSLQCSVVSSAAAEECAKMRADLIEMFYRRFMRAVEGGELPSSVSPRGLAHFYAAVLSGMSTQAVDGRSVDVFEEIIEAAMDAWPDPRGCWRPEGALILAG